jgi:hypothetical protein
MLPNSKSAPSSSLFSRSNFVLICILFIVVGVSFFNDAVEIETFRPVPCPTAPSIDVASLRTGLLARRQAHLPGQVCLPTVYGCFNWQSLPIEDQERMAVRKCVNCYLNGLFICFLFTLV